jgi:hypothetical protein
MNIIFVLRFNTYSVACGIRLDENPTGESEIVCAEGQGKREGGGDGFPDKSGGSLRTSYQRLTATQALLCSGGWAVIR